MMGPFSSSQVIWMAGFREEGVSYHYVEASDEIEINPLYIDEFIEILKKYDFDYTKGYTWTTDAFFRETREKIIYFKDKGAVCVEMEGTAISARKRPPIGLRKHSHSHPAIDSGCRIYQPSYGFHADHHHQANAP